MQCLLHVDPIAKFMRAQCSKSKSPYFETEIITKCRSTFPHLEYFCIIDSWLLLQIIFSKPVGEGPSSNHRNPHPGCISQDLWDFRFPLRVCSSDHQPIHVCTVYVQWFPIQDKLMARRLHETSGNRWYWCRGVVAHHPNGNCRATCNHERRQEDSKTHRHCNMQRRHCTMTQQHSQYSHLASQNAIGFETYAKNSWYFSMQCHCTVTQHSQYNHLASQLAIGFETYAKTVDIVTCNVTAPWHNIVNIII